MRVSSPGWQPAVMQAQAFSFLHRWSRASRMQCLAQRRWQLALWRRRHPAGCHWRLLLKPFIWHQALDVFSLRDEPLQSRIPISTISIAKASQLHRRGRGWLSIWAHDDRYLQWIKSLRGTVATAVLTIPLRDTRLLSCCERTWLESGFAINAPLVSQGHAIHLVAERSQFAFQRHLYQRYNDPCHVERQYCSQDEFFPQGFPCREHFGF